MEESSPIEPAEQETARRRFLKLAVCVLAAVNGPVAPAPEELGRRRYFP